MQIRLPYGHSYLTGNLPDHLQVDIIEPPQIPAADNPLGMVNSALDDLLGGVEWSAFASAKTVAIAVNDKTRPVPHQFLLPPLLERLQSLGIPDEAIRFYVAVGAHPPMDKDEAINLLPDNFAQRYSVVSHDSEDKQALAYLGETSRRTPIWVNRDYVQSDVKIVIGNIEPHQFVGYSGGVKSAAIGLAGIETINFNHALMTLPDAILGEFELNPVRQDIEEMGHQIGVHLTLNAILDNDRHIVKVLAGTAEAVMEAGVPIAHKIRQVAVPDEYGLVITSPGGHPKDINVYQSQKAVAHAARITKPGGTIILTAASPEGSGSSHYQDWVLGKKSNSDVISSFIEEGFQLGPHKAFLIARDATRFRLFSCTELEDSFARALLLNPVESLQAAIDIALEDLRSGERIGVLTHAVSTIPHVELRKHEG